MNKRARLARRILREHRAGAECHFVRVYGTRKGVEVFDFFTCPRCPKWDSIHFGASHAYR